MPADLLELRDQHVVVGGEPESVAVEHGPDPRKNDHVWITIHAGNFKKVRIALSTLSRQSRNAGFDPRLRVGISRSTWSVLPAAGIHRSSGLDYSHLESAHAVEFVIFERADLEELLVAKTRRAIFIEAWGELYVRAHIGIHQVHSRRASFAIPHDLFGRDGAIRFYFSPNETELLLFKFAGQL